MWPQMVKHLKRCEVGRRDLIDCCAVLVFPCVFHDNNHVTYDDDTTCYDDVLWRRFVVRYIYAILLRVQNEYTSEVVYSRFVSLFLVNNVLCMRTGLHYSSEEYTFPMAASGLKPLVLAMLANIGTIMCR
jgi:hypothetical protein